MPKPSPIHVVNYISFAAVILVSGGFLYMDAISGMWKHDLAFMGIGALILVMLGVSALIGRRLAGKFRPTERHFTVLLLSAEAALILGGVSVFAVALNIQYRPLLVWVLGPCVAIAIPCFIGCALIRGMRGYTAPTPNP